MESALSQALAEQEEKTAQALTLGRTVREQHLESLREANLAAQEAEVAKRARVGREARQQYVVTVAQPALEKQEVGLAESMSLGKATRHQYLESVANTLLPPPCGALEEGAQLRNRNLQVAIDIAETSKGAAEGMQQQAFAARWDRTEALVGQATSDAGEMAMTLQARRDGLHDVLTNSEKHADQVAVASRVDRERHLQAMRERLNSAEVEYAIENMHQRRESLRKANDASERERERRAAAAGLQKLAAQHKAVERVAEEQKKATSWTSHRAEFQRKFTGIANAQQAALLAKTDDVLASRAEQWRRAAEATRNFDKAVHEQQLASKLDREATVAQIMSMASQQLAHQEAVVSGNAKSRGDDPPPSVTPKQDERNRLKQALSESTANDPLEKGSPRQDTQRKQETVLTPRCAAETTKTKDSDHPEMHLQPYKDDSKDDERTQAHLASQAAFGAMVPPSNEVHSEAEALPLAEISNVGAGQAVLLPSSSPVAPRPPDVGQTSGCTTDESKM